MNKALLIMVGVVVALVGLQSWQMMKLNEKVSDQEHSLQMMRVEMKEQKTEKFVGVNESTAAAVALSKLPESELRMQTAKVLGQIPSESAEKRLIEMVLDDPDLNTRRTALQELKQRDSKRLPEVCLEILKKGSDKERVNAARMMSEAPTRGYAKDVGEILGQFAGSSHTDLAVTQYLVTYFRRAGDPAAFEILEKMLWAERDRIRAYKIARALVACSNEGHVDKLRAFLENTDKLALNESAQDVRIPLFQQLKDLKDAGSTKVLLSFLGDHNRFVVREALLAVLEMKDPKAATELVAAQDKLTGYELGRLQSAFETGFPGIDFDKESRKGLPAKGDVK